MYEFMLVYIYAPDGHGRTATPSSKPMENRAQLNAAILALEQGNRANTLLRLEVYSAEPVERIRFTPVREPMLRPEKPNDEGDDE